MIRTPKHEPMPKGIKLPFTEENENHVRKNYLVTPIKTLARECGVSQTKIRSFLQKEGLTIPKETTEQRKIDSQLKKGNVPLNKGKKQSEWMSKESLEKVRKTQFKTGNVPHNANYDGHERISKDGYVEIRVSAGNYRLKHIVEWEKVNGTIPQGNVLSCVDGNKENTEPTNWKMISRSELMKRNTRHNLPNQDQIHQRAVESRNETIRKERMRIRYGLPQQTKMKLNGWKQPIK